MGGLKHIIWIYLSIAWMGLQAQGNDASFGQNRLPKKSLNFTTIDNGRIEVNYYDTSTKLPKTVIDIAQNELESLENTLKYKLGSHANIFLFNTQYDYQHSYASLRDPAYNSNLIYKLPDDFVNIYYTGNTEILRQQIRQGLCELMLNEMLYGMGFSEKIQHLRGQEIPEWFTKGLPLFMAYDWKSEMENELREGFRNGDFRNTNTLNPRQTALLGVSIWRYLVKTYGTESLSSLLFITRYSARLDEAIYFLTKKSTSEVFQDWKMATQREFADENQRYLPKGKANISKQIASKNHASFELSPNGNLAAIKTYEDGKYAIWIFNIAKQQSKRVMQGGVKVKNQLGNPDYPMVKWKNNNEILVLNQEQDKYVITSTDINGRVNQSHEITQLEYIHDFISVADSIFLIGSENETSNLYLYSNNNLDLLSETVGWKYDLFLYQNRLAYLEKKNGLNYLVERHSDSARRTIINTKGELKSPIVYPNGQLGLLCNASGIYNAYALNDKGELEPITNYKASIIDQQVAGNNLAEMLKYKGKHAIYTSEVENIPVNLVGSIPNCQWQADNKKIDSMVENSGQRINQMMEISVNTDSARKDHRIFYLHGMDTSLNISGNNNANTFVKPENKIRMRPFYTKLNYRFVALHLDNSMLGNYLYHAPLLPVKFMRNNLVSIAANTVITDDLNTTKLEAGIRVNTILTNTDYWFKFDYNKFKIGHGLIFNRRSRKYERVQGIISQNISWWGAYVASFAWDPRLRSALSLGYRNELVVNKLSSNDARNVPEFSRQYIIVEPELVFDNTVAKYTNYNQGIKAKVGLKNFFNKDGTISFLQMDLRSNHWLGKRVLLASRLSAAYSLTSKGTLFLVGGMENLISGAFEQENLNIINPTKYDFQSLTGNMRGFLVGARYGSSFFVFNNELRLPVHKFLYKSYPYNSFLRELEVYGFWDLGTAFTGGSPSAAGNPYNTTYTQTSNYNISNTSQRNPYLNGFGFGAKSKVLGYELRWDYGFGLKEGQWQVPVNYLTLANKF